MYSLVPTKAKADWTVRDEQKFTETRPHTVSSYEVEAGISRPGVRVEIRRFCWDKPLPATRFRMPACYLSLALTPRPASGEVGYLGEVNRQAYASLGSCSFVPAGYEAYARGSVGEYRELSCLFDEALLEPYMTWEWTPLELAACFDIRNIHIRTNLLRLAEEVIRPGYASEKLVDALVTSVFVELSRHFRCVRAVGETHTGKLTSRQLQVIEDRVRDSLSTDLHTEQLADECGVSSRHLARMFKKTTGRTLGDYIAEVRIGSAKLLLSQPDSMIKEVAYQCGFHSQSAFSQAFRKATGLTPSQFRRKTFS
jgi:AraC family transcriptional regulator